MEEIVKQVLAILNGMWKFRWHGLIAAWVVAIVVVLAHVALFWWFLCKGRKDDNDP